jgi:transposase-like protein
MKRTKHTEMKTPAVNGQSQRVRKSKCTEAVVEQTFRLCLLGHTNAELAIAFDVSKATLNNWIKKYDDFKQAVEQGRAEADAEVAEALYHRAVGYEQPATKVLKSTVKEYDDDGNVISSHTEALKVPYTEHIKPSVKAIKLWLSARQNDNWGDKKKVHHEHGHVHVGGTNIHTILEQISDESEFTDEELQTIAKLGLKKGNEVAEGTE